MIDIKSIRKDFPMLNNKTMQGKELVFLDNASTTFKPNCVVEAVNKYLKDETSNSHRGDYDLCYNVDVEISKTRELIASFLNAESNEVVFTSGDSMSLNLIAYGLLKTLHEGDEILLTEAEHASNVLPWFRVAKMTGAIVKYVPLTNEGVLTPENVEKAITNKTKIISFAHVTNVLGYVNDAKGIAEVAHKHDVLVVCDGAQSVPHMKIDVKNLDIDFLCFSGHKMCGPTGIGILYGKYNLLNSLDPLLTGGGMNVKFELCGDAKYLNAPAKFEAGTLNIEGIYGLKAAVQYLLDIGMDNIQCYERELKTYAINKLKENEDIVIYNENSQSGIITFNHKKVFAQDLSTLLNSKGIAVRSGQHCAKMLNDFLKTPATVRASLYFYSSKEEIDALCEALKKGGDFLDAYFN